MTQRRQVGFIRTYSNKNIHFQDQPSQFSYFKIKGGKHDEEFSPYKFEDNQPTTKIVTMPPRQVPAKPPLPQRRTLKDKISSYLHGKAEAEEYYEKIKQKIASYEEKQSQSKQKLQQNIGNIRNKIERLDQVLKDLKSNKQHSVQKRPSSAKKCIEKHQQIEKESSQSSSEQEIVIKAIPSPKIVDQSSKVSSKQRISSQKSKQRSSFKQTLSKGVKCVQKQQGQQQSSRQNYSSKSKQQNGVNENVITFNSRIKNQPTLYIKSYSSSSSSETQQREQMQQNNYLETRNIPERQNQSKQEFYKNRGGVCFEVDVKQFTAPIPVDKKERQPKPKKEKVDKKAEILKRRETAKAYDKMTRRAIFSPY